MTSPICPSPPNPPFGFPSPPAQIRQGCRRSLSSCKTIFITKPRTLTLTLTLSRPASTTSTLVASSSSSSSSSSASPWLTEPGNFSISDETLSSKGFEFRTTMEGIDLDQLNALFVKVGFPRREKQRLEAALRNTPSLLWLQEVKSQSLVAFARATGDDVFNAIIWDVVVDPSYQGLGFGKALMERLMFDLVQKGITNICLFAEPNVVGFYKPLGYITDPQGIRAMSLSKKGK